MSFNKYPVVETRKKIVQIERWCPIKGRRVHILHTRLPLVTIEGNHCSQEKWKRKTIMMPCCSKEREKMNNPKREKSANVGSFHAVTKRDKTSKYPEISLNCPTTQLQLEKIQNYINSFQYNTIGKSFFKRYMRKNRGMNHLIRVVQKIVVQTLPIQCVEGVFLAVFLTNNLSKKGHIIRLPITFRSTFQGEAHSHMILAIRVAEGDGLAKSYKWGSLGISRISTLMYKEAKYASLLELVQDFHGSYTDCWHDLQQIVLGLPFQVPNNNTTIDKILPWNVITLQVSSDRTRQLWEHDIDKFAAHCESASDYYYNHAKDELPDWWSSLFSSIG